MPTSIMCMPQPGTSAPPSTSYIPQPYSKVVSKPIDKVALLVTTNADNFTLVDVSGAMTGAFIRERIFSKVSFTRRILVANIHDYSSASSCSYQMKHSRIIPSTVRNCQDLLLAMP